MLTLATPCDGILECLHGEDETWICDNKKIIIWIVMGSVGLMIGISTALKYRKRRKRSKNISETKKMSEKTDMLTNMLNTEDFSKNNMNLLFWKSINVMVLFYQWVLSDKLRVNMSRQLYSLVVDQHGGNEVEAKLSLKRNLHHSIYKIVHEDNFPGIMRRYFSELERFLHNLENRSILWWVLSTVRQCFTIYLDIFKDFFIALVVFTVSGGFIALWTFPTKLTSVVFFCFILSILLPLLISSHVLARDRIQQSGPSSSRKEKIWIYTKTMCLSLLNPLLIVDQYESKNEKMKEILKDSVEKKDGIDVDAVIKLLEEQDILRKQYLEFMRMDLGLETIYQTAGQFVLLLLAAEDHTDSTATTGGLEKIFRTDYLTWSVFLSLRTCVSLYFKSVSLEKPFFPMTSKILVYLSASLSVSKRIFVIVIFFIPSFGLLRLLVHWTYEKIPFTVRQNRNYNSEENLQIFGKPPVLWSEVDRWNYEENIPPPITLYTGPDLGNAFLVFWAIFLLHISSILITKFMTARPVRESNILDMILHAVQNSNIPFPFRDWDVDNGTIEDHRARFGAVLREVICVMAVNFFFNSLLLVPLIYTGL